MRQFETHCNRCGRKILMTYDDKNRRWVPCDCEIRKYRRSGGPFTYVNPNGETQRGMRTFSGDPAGEWGYQKHLWSCTADVGKAV